MQDKEIGALLYKNTKQEFNKKELLFIAFILLDKTILENRLDLKNLQNLYSYKIDVTSCKNWAQDALPEHKDFLQNLEDIFNLVIFSDIELFELAVRSKNIDLVKNCVELLRNNGLDPNISLKILGRIALFK